MRIVLPPTFLLILAVAVMLGHASRYLLSGYLALSGLTWLLYAWDKRAARRHDRRTPEHILHWLALAGGWPGAMLAQHQLHHKSRKLPFLRVFYASVAGNLLLLYLLLSWR